MKTVTGTIESVIRKVLWTSSASTQNQRILAEAIAEKLTGSATPTMGDNEASDKAWALARSLQAQVKILETAVAALSLGASRTVAADAMQALATHREQEAGFTEEESPSGGPMVHTVLLADPMDIEDVNAFGGDLTTGFHKAAQLVRAHAISESLRNGDSPVLRSLQ